MLFRDGKQCNKNFNAQELGWPKHVGHKLLETLFAVSPMGEVGILLEKLDTGHLPSILYASSMCVRNFLYHTTPHATPTHCQLSLLSPIAALNHK